MNSISDNGDDAASIKDEGSTLSTIRKLAAEVVHETALARVGALHGEFLNTPLSALSDEREQGVLLRTVKDIRLFLYHVNPNAHVHHIGEKHVTFDRVELKRVPPPPHGYAYKGGAARLAVLELLGHPVGNQSARDLDLVRIGTQETSRDKVVGQEYMPEDFQHGYGVELTPSICRYLSTRDFTINETLYYTDRIVASRAAIQDMYNGCIRPTPHVLHKRNQLPGNIVTKMLRFQAEAKLEGRSVRVVGIPADQKVSPFDIALHLDRALGRSPRLAKQYLTHCIEYGLLCPQRSQHGEIAASMRYLSELAGSSFKQFPSFAALRPGTKKKIMLHQNLGRSHRRKKRA